MIPRILASTTSHKAEPLLPTLEIFGRLGLTDIDLNLHHIIEGGVSVSDIRRALDEAGARAWVLSGGWCDFFDEPPSSDRTFASVARQVAIAGDLDVSRLRLFFGRLSRANYTAPRRDRVCAHLRDLSARHPQTQFAFENHDGASLDPAVCREIFEQVDCANIRMNFDPINFEKVGVNSPSALEILRPWIAHVHLKGLEQGNYCEFGVGEVDLAPVIDSLMQTGFTGSFSVEYEGSFDKTLRLYESVKRARKSIG